MPEFLKDPRTSSKKCCGDPPSDPGMQLTSNELLSLYNAQSNGDCGGSDNDKKSTFKYKEQLNTNSIFNKNYVYI